MMKSVFIDFEFNTAPTGKFIIEVGACLGERDFQSYVFTERKISYAVRKLTGITQEQVDQAPSFPEVMDRFFGWLGEEFEAVYSWSMTDLSVLRENCDRYGYTHPLLERMMRNWKDAQLVFAHELHYDRLSQVPSLANAVRALEIPGKGREHTALVDAWEARAVLMALTDPKRNHLVEIFRDLFCPKEEHLGYGLGAMLKAVGF